MLHNRDNMEYFDDDSDIESDTEREEPDMVDKYILKERCAGGAFSAVYHGENVRTGAPVAIKTESICSGRKMFLRNFLTRGE